MMAPFICSATGPNPLAMASFSVPLPLLDRFICDGLLQLAMSPAIIGHSETSLLITNPRFWTLGATMPSIMPDRRVMRLRRVVVIWQVVSLAGCAQIITEREVRPFLSRRPDGAALNRNLGCVSLGAMTRGDFPAKQIFDWYDRHGRTLPWRRHWPDLSPAYHVWLSEIMLQQTVVATVIPYFLDFTRRWPDICDLAAAPAEDVMAAWAGLGYYARARNLHRAAQIVCGELGGRFPQDEDGLRALPGVGPYTAGAIAAIAFGRPSVVVDGNIERVMARYFAVETPLPLAKAELGAHYAAVRPDDRPSDFPQALMDFANAVCTPKNPGCLGCPVSEGCAARQAGTQDKFPVKPPKKAKPARRGIAFVAIDGDGSAFMQIRPERGMLGGMSAFPSAGWTEADPPFDPDKPFASAPFDADWHLAKDQVGHVFTHFSLTMDVAVARLDAVMDGAEWQKVRISGLPTLMRKVWETVRKAQAATVRPPNGPDSINQ